MRKQTVVRRRRTSKTVSEPKAARQLQNPAIVMAPVRQCRARLTGQAGLTNYSPTAVLLVFDEKSQDWSGAYEYSKADDNFCFFLDGERGNLI